MRVLPIARLFIVCDSAILDLADDKWSIKNPWYKVQMPPGIKAGFIQQSMTIYTQIVQGVGKYRFSIQITDETGASIVCPEREERILIGGIVPREMVFDLKMVPFARPGLYEFQLLANYASIPGACTSIGILEGD